MLLFTPAARSSAIARMAALVVPELLARGVHVTVVRTEDAAYVDSPSHALGVPVLRWDDRDAVTAAARQSDTIVYQVGNSYEFHRGCLEWLRPLGGVVCLHDFFLGHLFWKWAEEQRTEAADVLRAWYGDAMAARYFSFPGPAAFIEATHDAAPMVEWVAALADGVLTHASWGIDRVLAACPGPVDVAALPYDAPGAQGAPGIEETSAPQRPFTILTFGHLNPNKRMDSVIRALGRSGQLRTNAVYRLVGRIEPEAARELRAHAERRGVQLSIDGEVDDHALQEAIRRADVVCCARLPALEAASASAIESMLYGRPVLALDVGFYSELPDDCVRKISPHDEIAGLQRELDRLFSNPEERRLLGTRARQWALGTFRAEAYAERLASVCERASRGAPLIEASRRFGATLRGWGAPESQSRNPFTLEPLRVLAAGSRQPGRA